MSPERWEQISLLLADAIELAAEERCAFIEKKCVDDPELRDQVLYYLRQYESGSRTQDLPTSAAPKAIFSPGDLVSGRYRVHALLGRGGMGEVYEVEDQEFGGRLALKTIRADFASNAAALDRFRGEVRLARRVKHPNVCAVHHIDRHQAENGTIVYLTMELISGEPLSDYLRSRGRLALPEALSLIHQMADALSAAHHAGIIHRDFKPGNVMVQPAPPAGLKAVVTDFGLARLVAKSEDGSVTVTGRAAGTAAYMAPEQILGEEITPAVDVYALGLVAYEILCGCRPFEGQSATRKRISERPPSPVRHLPDLDAAAEAALLRCLDPHPAQRFQDPLDFSKALRQSAGDTGTVSNAAAPPRGRRRWLLSVPTAAAAILLGWALWAFVIHPAPSVNPEAKRWLDIGTAAIRDGVYWKATRALTHALSIDISLPIAHARLAEAWSELDSPDKARDEMLLAEGPGDARNNLSGADAEYRDAIHLTIARQFPQAVAKYREILNRVPSGDKPYGYLDLGRAYEKAGQPLRALECYHEAAARASSSPGPFVRLGILNRKRRNPSEATKNLEKAESLYRDENDNEGVAEVEYLRARLTPKPAEARELLSDALIRAKSSEDLHQQIRVLLQMGVTESQAGQIAEAKDYARRAIAMARDNGEDILVARGLVDLANALYLSGSNTEAEGYFNEAMSTAHRNHADRQEYAALLGLGSLYIHTGRAEEGLAKVERAGRFFEANGYQEESAQAYYLAGRHKRDEGNYTSAAADFRNSLAIAEKTGDPSQVADARYELGMVFLIQERLPEAVEQFRGEIAIRQDLGARPDIAYAAANLSNALAEMGMFDEAGRYYSLAVDSAAGLELLGSLPVDRARMLAQQRKFREAEAICAEALQPKARAAESLIEASKIMAVCHLNSNRALSARKYAEQAVAASALASRANHLSAQLVLAASLLAGRDFSAALSLARALQPEFERGEQRCSQWKSLLIAARAARGLEDDESARKYAAKGVEVLSSLERSWGSAAYNAYVAQPILQDDLRTLKGMAGNQ